MNICFPVEKNAGLNSLVYGHFGSAPQFVVVNTESGDVVDIANRDLHHAHGQCSPFKALEGHPVDAIVVAGIGGGALQGLLRAGVTVYRAQGITIADNLTCLSEDALAELAPGQVCGGHQQQGGHGNRHGHTHGCQH